MSTHALLPPRRAIAALLLAPALAFMGAVPTASAADAPSAGVIPDTAVPEILVAPDSKRIELGLRFSPSNDGTLRGIQFFQNAFDSGVTSASVWSSSGDLLARVPVNPWGPPGWRTIPVDVALTAGTEYTVSVYDSNGRPPATAHVFDAAATIDGISTPHYAGVYRYGSASGFPSLPADGYSFLVDVVFSSAPETPEPEPVSPSDPTPVPDLPPAPEVEEPAPPTTPETPTAPVEDVYGPDGTHWPTNTPHADGARVVTAAASWSAISSAIAANARSTDPVVICVAPGTIVGGNGAGSTSKGVLQDIGNPSRVSRILVTACDGPGSVRVGPGPGIAFVGVHGVSIIGIDLSAQTVMIRNTQSFAIGYSKVPGLLVTANGGAGVRDVELVEIVAGPDAVHGVSHDRVEVKSAGGYSVDGLRFVGFYGAPHYKPNGSRGHSDTIQFVTTSGNGVIANVTIEDSVVFQSADQAIMAGGNVGGSIIHSAFFGGTVGQLRYPMYAGGDPITLANVLHGTWSNVSVEDALVAGSISSAYTFTQVSNARSYAGARGFAPLGTLTLADLDRLAPAPTDDRLAAIWG